MVVSKTSGSADQNAGPPDLSLSWGAPYIPPQPERRGFTLGRVNELNEPLKEIFHLFSTGFGSTFSPTLQSRHVLIATPTDMQGLEVLCVPLSANTFLLAPPYVSRRDAGRRLGILAL